MPDLITEFMYVLNGRDLEYRRQTVGEFIHVIVRCTHNQLASIENDWGSIKWQLEIKNNRFENYLRTINE